MKGEGDWGSARGRLLEFIQKIGDDGVDGMMLRMLGRGVDSVGGNTTGLRAECATGGTVGLGE